MPFQKSIKNGFEFQTYTHIYVHNAFIMSASEIKQTFVYSKNISVFHISKISNWNVVKSVF